MSAIWYAFLRVQTTDETSLAASSPAETNNDSWSDIIRR